MFHLTLAKVLLSKFELGGVSERHVDTCVGVSTCQNDNLCGVSIHHGQAAPDDTEQLQVARPV